MSAQNAVGRFARLLALVPFLQSHQGIPISQAAESMGVSEKELLADLHLLWVCGLPGYTHSELIDLEFESGRITIENADTLAKPLSLTSDEVIALSMGLAMLAALPKNDLSDDLRSAQIKIQAMALQAAELTQLTKQVMVIPASLEAEDTAHLLALENAITNKKQIEIDYYVASRDEMTTRIIEAERIRLVDGVSYVDAWCQTADAARIFRLDRIFRTELLATAHSHESDTFSQFQEPGPQPEYQIALAPTGRWILEQYGAQLLANQTSSKASATIPVGDRNWLLRLALSAGGDLEIMSEAELQDDLIYLARLALANYEGE